MVRRVSFHKYGYIAFALIVLLFCWESNKTNAAVFQSGIPEEAIRLRILANSDSVQDQAIKRLIRDAIVEEVDGWVTVPASIEEAREQVEAHLPVFRELIAEILEKRGYDYEFKVELGSVEFPTKLYGSRVYPAGDYEALKVTLGSGQGQNWWCVLFPPLCFVDVASGQAVAQDKEDSTSSKGKKEEGQGTSQLAKDTKGGDGQSKAQQEDDSLRQASLQAPADREVRFFLWDLLQGLLSWVKGWFA